LSLTEYTLEGKLDKVKIAIGRLKMFEPPEGYYLAFSGGKDSQVIYEIAKLAGVKFDTHFNFTTVDPPELLKFIRENYPDVEWHRPEKTMFRLIIEKHFPPTRLVRYCCDYLKERGGDGRFVITGIRREESYKRSKRQMVHVCIKNKTKKFIHPIIDWTEKDVWEFIKSKKLKYCSLYNEGYTRIGCVLCPMQTVKGKLRDIERYPNFYKAYLKAFKEMLKIIKDRDLNTTWQNEKDVMNWWLRGEANKKQIKQDKLFI